MSKPEVASSRPTEAVFRIVKSAEETHGKIVEGREPSMSFPLRNFSSVRSGPPAKLQQPEKFLP